MSDHGVTLADGDPASAGRAILLRLIRLAHGRSATDGAGRMRYSIDAAGLTPRVASTLPRLARAEHRIAAVELSCRLRLKREERSLSLEAAARVETGYADEIAHLRLALIAADRDDTGRNE
jgi:hypothetical protein